MGVYCLDSELYASLCGPGLWTLACHGAGGVFLDVRWLRVASRHLPVSSHFHQGELVGERSLAGLDIAQYVELNRSGVSY